jgi:hypothetical protein
VSTAVTAQPGAKSAAKFSCEQAARAALGEPAKREGAELVYRCPHPEGHKDGDSHPSLKINPKKNVWACFPCGASGTAWSLAAFLAGCDPGDKVAVTAWLVERGLFSGTKPKRKADGRGPCVATYVYTDVVGKSIARKLRFEPGPKGKAKDFSWERWEGGKWVSGLGDPKISTPLYRVAKIINESFAVLTEGEKDTDAGANLGLPTATSGGTGSWREDHAECLRGKSVVIVADADEPGRVEAQKRAASLYGKAASVRVCEIPDCKDLAKAIESGWTRERLLSLFSEMPEWKPATGAEILDAVMRFIRRFVSLTEAQARAVALWVAHTHAFGAAASTPYLAVNSAEKQSGKTRLLEVSRLLVSRAWFTGRTSAAVLTRKIDAEHPTLLLDESDAAFGGEKEYAEALRGILNTGYRLGGAASCCVGQGVNITPKDFSTFCPKAIAGIGKLPDTVIDRSIPIRLKRARRGEVARFREREAQREGPEIAARLATWCAANLETLRQARPEIPAQLSDRQADTSEPLLAVADLAGGDWPKAARQSLVKLCGEAQADDDSIGVKLLSDIKGIFAEKEGDEIPSGELCEALAKIETSPWGEWAKGKPLSPAKLARLLKPFDIFPGQIKNGLARGYRLGDFREAFSLYLPPSPPIESVKVSETRESRGDGELLKVSNESPSDTLKNAVSPNKDAASRHFDTLKAGIGGQENGEKEAKTLPFQEVREVLDV